MKVTIGDQELDVQPAGDSVSVDGETYSLRVVRNANIVTVYLDEKPYAVQLPQTLPDDGPVKVYVDAKEYEAEVKGGGARAKPKAKAKKTAAVTGALLSQMTGRVIRVEVSAGASVKEGDVLLVIEAMKMENEITAPMNGIVTEVSVAAGARVSEGDPLLVIQPEVTE